MQYIGEVKYKGKISGIDVYDDVNMEPGKVLIGHKQGDNKRASYILLNCDKMNLEALINDLSLPLPKIKHLTF
jgi:hypothetical protein